MTRILLLAVLLTACTGCPQQQIVPDAQAQLTLIASVKDLAHDIADAHCLQVDSPPCDAVRTAGYDAESALATANSQRTAKTINDALLKAIAYSTAAKELVH